MAPSATTPHPPDSARAPCGYFHILPLLLPVLLGSLWSVIVSCCPCGHLLVLAPHPLKAWAPGVGLQLKALGAVRAHHVIPVDSEEGDQQAWFAWDWGLGLSPVATSRYKTIPGFPGSDFQCSNWNERVTLEESLSWISLTLGAASDLKFVDSKNSCLLLLMGRPR